MGALEIELLIGLYFIGVSVPGLVSVPRSRSAEAQVIFGIILVVLAFLHVSLIR